MAKHRYIKAKNPAQFTYFTDESIKKYDPAKGGWVRDSTVDHPAPLDVINFMKEKPVEPVVVTAAVNDFSTVPTSKLQELFTSATEDDLLNVIKNDGRTTAVRYAEKEIKNRQS